MILLVSISFITDYLLLGLRSKERKRILNIIRRDLDD